MPKPLDRQSGYRTLPINSRKLQALLSHPFHYPYRPHPIPTLSQAPVRPIQNIANPPSMNDPVKEAQIEI
jgi:hypothetical protein